MQDKKYAGRRLTKAEEARLEAFESRIAEMEEDGYEKTDLTVSAEKANFLGTLYGVLAVIPFMILFFLRSPMSSVSWEKGGLSRGISLVVLYFLLIIMHELIHGLTWSCFAKNGFRSISFGIIWRSLNPYCFCSEPLSGTGYMTGLLMPWFVLGIIPSIIAIFNRSGYLMILGAVMSLSAGGDLLIARMILKNGSIGKLLYLDHPAEIGLVCLEKA